MFDDGYAGGVELLREIPAGIEIDEIVEAEFLALQLGGSGDAGGGAVGVEGGALVRVFSIAERGCSRIGDAERGWELGFGRIGKFHRVVGGFGRRDLFERVGDGGVVGSGYGEGAFCARLQAGFAREAAGTRGYTPRRERGNLRRR